MKFIKKKPKTDDRVGYLLIINTMVGDADGNEDIEVGLFQENELHLLEEVINLCDRMIAEYPSGRGGYDNYNHVEGFERWFTDYDIENNQDIEHLAPFEWGYGYDYDAQNSIIGYKLLYLDKGTQYQVSIVRDK